MDGDADTDERADTDAHEIELHHQDGTISLTVSEDEYILDAAEEAGLELPYSCREGQCTSCVGKLVDGDIDHSEGTALDPMQRDDGFALLCITYPRSDCTIETEAQDDMFGGDLDVL
jgi:ferredoxin